MSIGPSAQLLRGFAVDFLTCHNGAGVETIMVRYPREGHGPSEPQFQVDHLQRTAAWFDRYLRAGD